MKKIIFGCKKNFYKANLHCHSNLSDGMYTPEELKKLYKSAGYSILAITDHEFVKNHSYLDDNGFLTITSTELAVKEFENVSTGVNRHMKVAHFNLYAKRQDNEYNACYNKIYDRYSQKSNLSLDKPEKDFVREYSGRGINKLIKTADENGFFVSYNHPRWSLENYVQYSMYEGIWGVEIFNTSCNTTGLYEYDINVVDDFLRDGKRVFVTSGDDNHKKEDTFGTFVMVNADRLEYDLVIDSLLKGDFYSSTGPEIFEISVDNNFVTVECSDAYAINLTTEGRRAKSIKADAGKSINKAQFELLDDDGYFRITVVDEYGKRADSQSYYLNDIR